MARKKVSMSERAEALKMSREIMRVEREGVAIARRITVYLRKEALQAVKEHRQFSITHKMFRELLETLEKAMQVSQLLGVRRAVLQSRQAARQKIQLSLQQPLRLSFLDETLFALQRLMEGYFASGELTTEFAIAPRVLIKSVQLIRDVTVETQNRLRETVDELIQERASVKTGKERLEEEFENLGLSGTDWQLETMFRTQTQLAYSGASYRALQSPAIQDILWGYKYVTVGDDRVRPEHELWDGVTLPKDDPFWNQYWVPNGWNCRCAIIPVYEQRNIVQPRFTADGIDALPDEEFRYNPGLL